MKKKPTGAENYTIAFSDFGITAKWDTEYENLLEFAEDQGVFPDFSCRSGIAIPANTSF